MLSSFFQQNAATVAQGLIGATLLVDGVGGVIVETEAYDHEDPASHSFGGETLRNASMFRPGGCAYVYRSYGIHWCLNAVCGPEGLGSAVLIRALQPTHGLAVMEERRGVSEPRLLSSGPGRLCQALAVDRRHDGLPLGQAPFSLNLPERPERIVAGPRVGISKGVATPWRFGLSGSPWISRPFR